MSDLQIGHKVQTGMKSVTMEFFLNEDIFCRFYRITRKLKKIISKILPQVGLDLRHLRLSIPTLNPTNWATEDGAD